jgi:hypothetical protein
MAQPEAEGIKKKKFSLSNKMNTQLNSGSRSRRQFLQRSEGLTLDARSAIDGRASFAELLAGNPTAQDVADAR